jgi:pimeloyl-ACP methyl ester carboxylesterase
MASLAQEVRQLISIHDAVSPVGRRVARERQSLDRQGLNVVGNSYQVYAVDLRGQGRSTWTPGRYSLDVFGGDLVRFIGVVIGRPVIVSGLSSGGTIAAWLSAFASPGQVVAAVYEDAPLFTSEVNPEVGQSMRQVWGRCSDCGTNGLAPNGASVTMRARRPPSPARSPAGCSRGAFQRDATLTCVGLGSGL